MIDTIDVVLSKTFVLDAQERSDGFIEAVRLNNSTDMEELLLFKPELESGQPVVHESLNPNDKRIEMYRWDVNVKTFFHSKKTLSKYKKTKKNDQDEPSLPKND